MASPQDIVVIGAGIVGVSTAIWLQRAGGLNVTLIDREGPAAGTSHGNAGILASAAIVPVPTPGILLKAPGMLLDPMQPLFLRWSYLPKIAPFLARFLANAKADRVEKIAAALSGLLSDAVDQHKSLAAGTPGAAYVKDGDWIWAYESRKAFEKDAWSWDLRLRNGHRFEEMDADALAAHDPALEGRFGYGVRKLDHGYISDPGAYVRALHGHFLASGGTAVQAEVTDIRLVAGRAVAVVTNQGEVAADEVVVTTGAWSGPLAKRLGVKIPLESERGYHVEYVNPSFTPRTPVMVAAGKFVATPMEGRLRCAGVVELGGLKSGSSEAPFRLIEKQAKAAFPDLTYDRIDRWMGHRPSTSDSLPVIGRAPAAPNVWLGYGHQHVGLTGGPKTGRWLAGMIAGEAPNADLTRFDPGRGGVVR